MSDAKLSNLTQICNQKITTLNVKLKSADINQFYKVPTGAVSEEHIQRMIYDLDMLMAEHDTSKSIENTYLDIRSKLMELEKCLQKSYSLER